MRIIGLALTALLASSCVVVVTSDCHNGIQDGNETGIDCGGSCGPCGPIVSCTDGVRDGTETDVDCGGGSCGGCAGGRTCVVNADCAGGLCNGNVCTPHPTGAGTAPTAGDVASIRSGVGATTPAGGFGITANGLSAAVTFRITSLGAASTDDLYGSLWTAGGITAVTPGCGGQCEIATIDFVSQPYSSSGGQRVDFEFLAPTNPAGFDVDLTVNDQASPIYFDLYLNGQRIPQSTTFVSGDVPFAERAPATMPFALFAK